jgi:hypothetical protein
MTREDDQGTVSDMAVGVTRSRSLVGRFGWDELSIPKSYRAEIVDRELVVTPKVAGTAPPISVDEWDAVSVPEGYRAEIVQSELVVSPAPSFDHCVVQSELLVALTAVLPAELRLLAVSEWRFERRGHVAMAPQPDLVVLPRSVRRVEQVVLGVEVLSATDRRRLRSAPHLTRIEGKCIDYATNGLADYLEVDLLADQPVLTRYESHDGVMVEVDRAEGDKALVADRPFPYELVPAALLGP